MTVQLICAFDFAYAKSRFSHNMAHLAENKSSNGLDMYTTQNLIRAKLLISFAGGPANLIQCTNNFMIDM